MDEGRREEFARALLRAHAGGSPAPPPAASGESVSEVDAYAVQRELVRHWERQGATVRGWKIAAGPEGGPAYGHLMSTVFHPESRPVQAGGYLAPQVAPGIAFVLGRPLQGPGLNVADVSSAIAHALPALEIRDSRLEDGEGRRPEDEIADNASAGGLVLGSRQVPLTAFQPRLEGCVLYQGGRIAATGAGAAVHGSPLNAVTWLANALGDAGTALPAGSVVFSGPLTPAVRAGGGQTVTAAFTRLGVVTVHLAGPRA
ncbi:2-keto-4-pentenoate hydratase [Actinomadura rugatobispora]|uniref:2-keto-4-pentenoate hydratase n=1 Tax=Actinomadura rugatobispora TaxID=1994 RepID=A0ABW0ZLZ3_9ACTN|nr:fumarylacetoacetate hydrolase family protein [Actinomadura rugatobispora]